MSRQTEASSPPHSEVLDDYKGKHGDGKSDGFRSLKAHKGLRNNAEFFLTMERMCLEKRATPREPNRKKMTVMRYNVVCGDWEGGDLCKEYKFEMTNNKNKY